MSIRKIQRKKGVVYEARIALITGESKYRSFCSKDDALKYQNKLRAQNDLDSGRSMILGKIKVDEFFKTVWFPVKVSVLSESTQEAYLTHYELHIKNIVGHKRLSDVRAVDGDKLIAHLVSQGKNPKGVNLIVRTLKSMMNHAVQRDYILKNPLNSVMSLKESRKNDLFWEAHEAKAFLAGIKDHYSFALFVTALNTGMRRGELASLKWENVDFDRKRIIVAGTKDRRGDKDKTKGRADRTIPINERLFIVLSGLKKSDSCGYVFRQGDGNPINPHHLYRLMDTLRVRIGGIKKIRFHDLRHTFASHFMMNGGNITQLALILGHTDQRITQRYMHFAPNYLDSAAEVVSF